MLFLSGGHYCGTPGAAAVDGECAGGYYCEYGVDTATPSNNVSHLGAGGECPPGFYCPKGSTQPIPCPPGSYTTTASKFCFILVQNFIKSLWIYICG